MNKHILVTEPMPIVMQTEHEKVVKKIEDNHKEQVSSQLLQLQKEFAFNFVSASEIIFRLSIHGYYLSYKVKNFCERFFSSERLALEEGIRKHPKYKWHISLFLGIVPVLGVSSFATWGVAPEFVPVILGVVAVLLSFSFSVLYFCEPDVFVTVRHFFLRRKLIRLGGPKAPEEVIKEMNR